MPRVKRRPLAQTDILEIWDFIADDGIDVVRVLHGARDQKQEQHEQQGRTVVTAPPSPATTP